MASIKDKQQDTMASIDTAKAMVDKVMEIMGIMQTSPSLSLTFATNPIGFLLQLLKHLGITYEELRHWLTWFLTFIVPSLEIGVKTILLTNLKHMISCSVDPRIPEKYRKQHKVPSDSNTSQEYGIDIDIESIDFLDKLSVNPLSDEGKELYFGLNNIDDVYKFARADDFDAFLWFVKHKGKFPHSSEISNLQNTLQDNIHGYAATSTTPSDGTLLETVTANFSSGSPSTILLGNTFIYKSKSPHVIAMCIDRKYDEKNNIISNTLVPTTDDWTSVNWYARRADQLGKNLGFGWTPSSKENGSTSEYKGKGRDFSKERAICNLQYIDQASSTSPITGLINNKFRFTILPKPLVHIPNLEQGEPPWRFKKLLFDAKGNYDPNGKYTLSGAHDNTDLTYSFDGGSIVIEPKSGNVTINGKENLPKNLMECYGGLTVFEFNYDYVMSIKLFDAKVLATTLLDSLIDLRLGINMNISTSYIEATEKIKEIIKSIINTDDSELKDCFYTFDNSKYDALLKRAEKKRAEKGKKSSVQEIHEIFDEFDSNAELHEQIDVLHRAITQAAVTMREGSEESMSADVEFNLVFDMIENLVNAIVMAVLSPKVLMLLEVNQQIMGGSWEKFTMRDLIEAMQSIIVAIIKEVRDMVVQELLKLVLKQLEPIISMLSDILLREQLEYYADAIQDLIRNCPFIWFSFGNRYEDTKLDTVDYADIDTSSSNKEQPNTNNC